MIFLVLLLFAIVNVESCCPSSIPWQICNYIPVENDYSPKTCTSDFSRSGIPCSTRQSIMNRTLQLSIAAGGPCPFNTFSSIIGIHKGPSVSDFEVLCTGINNVGSTGATAHGEIEALRNCSAVLAASPKYGPSYVNNHTFWQTLSLYTTAESCPMCMSAIRFATLGEVIYGTTIESLHSYGWNQISIGTGYVQGASNTCNFGTDGTAMQTRAITNVLDTYINPYFAWQFGSGSCPGGCIRQSGFCVNPAKK